MSSEPPSFPLSDPIIPRSVPSRPVDPSSAWSWYRSLGSPRLIVAPMVNQSELAFRELTRRYGAQLVYTPMLHSTLFSKDPKYRADQFTTSPSDRPLIAQFCSNNPVTMVEAAKFIQNQVDAIDLNLGCPQGIARRGHYGSFLLEESELIASIVSTCYDYLSVPITCKIRLLHSEQSSIELAKRIEASGCSLLTVHGRHRESIKDRIGSVNFSLIKKIKESVKIPVFANGSVENMRDVEQILQLTGCDGVMSSEGILCNPALFVGIRPDSLQLSLEYLSFAHHYQTNSTAIRGHLFKILYRELCYWTEFREELATCPDEQLEDFIQRLDNTRKQERERREQQGESALEAVLEQFPTWYRRHLNSPQVKTMSVIQINREHLAAIADEKAAKEEKKEETSGIEEYCDFGCLLDG
jgi:tRNA-dihydrouridine synthase 1